MNDTVYRKDVIDTMEKIMADHPIDGYEDECQLINAMKSLPSAQTELEDKIRAIGHTGKEGRIYIGGRLFAVRELAQ